MAIKWPWSKQSYDVLAKLIAEESNREALLGLKPPVVPEREQISADAVKMTNYSRSGDYKLFAEEAWQRYQMHMDALMNEGLSPDRASYHRGAANEVLYLLRLSYEAREALKARNEGEQSVSPRR